MPGNLSSQVVVRAGTTASISRVVNKARPMANKTYCLMVDAMDEPTPTPTPDTAADANPAPTPANNGQLAIACLFGENQSQAFNFVPRFREARIRISIASGLNQARLLPARTTDLSSVTDTSTIFLGPNGGISTRNWAATTRNPATKAAG